MKLHRFIGDFRFAEKEIGISEPDFVHQAFTVLHLQKGEELVLCDGRGTEARAVIRAIDKKMVRVEILSVESVSREPRRQVVAYVAIIKRELFDLVVQKLTEIGVHKIIPVITRRTVKLAVKESRLAAIIREASEQSGRTTMPILHEPMEFKKALEHAQGNRTNLFFHATGDDRFLVPGLQAKNGIFIGPEGGWDDEEVTAAKEAGCIIASLGGLTLRAETAAIIAAYVASRE